MGVENLFWAQNISNKENWLAKAKKIRQRICIRFRGLWGIQELLCIAFHPSSLAGDWSFSSASRNRLRSWCIRLSSWKSCPGWSSRRLGFEFQYPLGVTIHKYTRNLIDMFQLGKLVWGDYYLHSSISICRYAEARYLDRMDVDEADFWCSCEWA